MGNYGIENIKLAIGPATNLVEAAVRIFQKPFQVSILINEILNLAFNFGIYRQIIQNGAETLKEAKDVDSKESLQLAEVFRQEFDLPNDVSEAQVEGIVLSAAEFHSRVENLLPVIRAFLAGGLKAADRLRLFGDAAKEVGYLAAWAIETFFKYRGLIEAKQLAEKKRMIEI